MSRGRIMSSEELALASSPRCKKCKAMIINPMDELCSKCKDEQFMPYIPFKGFNTEIFEPGNAIRLTHNTGVTKGYSPLHHDEQVKDLSGHYLIVSCNPWIMNLIDHKGYKLSISAEQCTEKRFSDSILEVEYDIKLIK